MRVLIFDLFKRQENLSFLLNLSEQIGDLFSSFWFLLLDVSVSQERNLGSLRFGNKCCLSFLLKLTCSWSTSHHRFSKLIASGTSCHLRASCWYWVIIIVLGSQLASEVLSKMRLLQSDQMRLIQSILVHVHTPIVSQRIQGRGILVHRMLAGSLIEKRLESGILLSILHAADDFADVILESCGWLPYMCRWLRCILISLLSVSVIHICLQSLNELLIHRSSVRARLDSWSHAWSWSSWAHASLLVRVWMALKSCINNWINGHHLSLFAILRNIKCLSPCLLYVESCASESKAMLNIEILAS